MISRLCRKVRMNQVVYPLPRAWRGGGGVRGQHLRGIWKRTERKLGDKCSGGMENEEKRSQKVLLGSAAHLNEGYKFREVIELPV